MTLTVGILTKDGIVMASDSRLSSDVYINDSIDKIVKLNDFMAVGLAGEGTIAKHILDLILQENKIETNKGVQLAAEGLCKSFSEYFGQYFKDVPFTKRPEIELLLVGYTTDNIPLIYELQSHLNFVPKQISVGYNAIGYPHIANYLINIIYEKGQIDTKNAAKLAVLAIRQSETQYKVIGGDIKVATFSLNKKFAILTSKEVNALEEESANTQHLQKSKFYPEEDTIEPL